MGFFKRAFEFLSHPTHSRTMGILIVFVLVAAVSLTVYVAQQQQQIKQRASYVVCEDKLILECTDPIVKDGNDCSVNPDFKCKITAGDKYNVYGCQ